MTTEYNGQKKKDNILKMVDKTRHRKLTTAQPEPTKAI